MEHVAREYEDKGFGRDRAQKIGESIAGKVARLKEPPVPHEHDTRGTDGVQP